MRRQIKPAAPAGPGVDERWARLVHNDDTGSLRMRTVGRAYDARAQSVARQRSFTEVDVSRAPAVSRRPAPSPRLELQVAATVEACRSGRSWWPEAVPRVVEVT